MENKILTKTETIKNNSDIIFFKKIEKFQNELETLKQKIKELNNDDIKKKLLEFDIEDLENKIKQYFISFKKYIRHRRSNNIKRNIGEGKVIEMDNFLKKRAEAEAEAKAEAEATINKSKKNTSNDAIINKLQEEFQEFKTKKQSQ